MYCIFEHLHVSFCAFIFFFYFFFNRLVLEKGLGQTFQQGFLWHTRNFALVCSSFIQLQPQQASLSFLKISLWVCTVMILQRKIFLSVALWKQRLDEFKIAISTANGFQVLTTSLNVYSALFPGVIQTRFTWQTRTQNFVVIVKLLLVLCIQHRDQFMMCVN